MSCGSQVASATHCLFTVLPPDAASSLSATRRYGARHCEGFAIDDRQILEHARAAAAPIFGADGEVLACIVVIGPTMRVTRAKVRTFAKSVRDTARRVSRELGYAAP